MPDCVLRRCAVRWPLTATLGVPSLQARQIFRRTAVHSQRAARRSTADEYPRRTSRNSAYKGRIPRRIAKPNTNATTGSSQNPSSATHLMRCAALEWAKSFNGNASYGYFSCVPYVAFYECVSFCHASANSPRMHIATIPPPPPKERKWLKTPETDQKSREIC